MVTLAINVVIAMMFAARRSFPPSALAITKLAAAVGLAKNRNINPNSAPEKPSAQAAVVHSVGKTTIFISAELKAVELSLRRALNDTVAPMHSRASGSVREAK